MPKDGADTRQRLLLAAEQLFAERGVWQVATGDIVKAAGQRNASALSYHFGPRDRHFGPRDKVLEAVLVDHGDPIDELRGELRTALDDQSGIGDFVSLLVAAMAPSLGDLRGRRYLQIVDQISGLAFRPNTVEAAMPANLREVLAQIRTAMSPSVPRMLHDERLKAMVMLMSASLADRGRRLNSDGEPALDHHTYITNLTNMLVGVLVARVEPALVDAGAEPVSADES